MERMIYIIFGQNFDYEHDGMFPKEIIRIYSSYEAADLYIKNTDFDYDIVSIEYEPLFD